MTIASVVSCAIGRPGSRGFARRRVRTASEDIEGAEETPRRRAGPSRSLELPEIDLLRVPVGMTDRRCLVPRVHVALSTVPGDLHEAEDAREALDLLGRLVRREPRGRGLAPLFHEPVADVRRAAPDAVRAQVRAVVVVAEEELLAVAAA